MSLEVGAIVEGEVTGITNFGAFVQLPEGKVGLIHISEVSNVYVLSKFLKDSDDRLLDLKRNTESKRGGRGASRER